MADPTPIETLFAPIDLEKSTAVTITEEILAWRARNWAVAVGHARRFLRVQGITPQHRRIGALAPVLEPAGASDDPLLAKMFGRVLALLLRPDADDDAAFSYARTLAQLAPVDAKVLDLLYRSVVSDRLVPEARYTKEIWVTPTANVLCVPEEPVALAFYNLEHHRLCEVRLPDARPRLRFTHAGWALATKCCPSAREERRRAEAAG